MGSSPPPRLDDRGRIEEQLLQEVRDAKAEYENSKTAHEQLTQVARDLGLLHPDGRAAIRNATTAQSAATRRYAKALHAFSEFLLGRPPR